MAKPNQPKRRGRPRLSEEEKLRRQEARKAEKLKEQKRRAKRKKTKQEKIPEIIKETKLEIMENPTQLMDSELIQNAIEEVPQVSFSNSTTIGLEEISANWTNQTNLLSEKITDLEEELLSVTQRLEKLNKISKKFEIERKLIKELNKYEQDLIYENELILIEIDQGDYQYQADLPLPDWILEILQSITKKPNELLVNKKISTYHYKLQNRAEQLVKLDTELADITLVIFYNYNLFEILKTTISHYRNVRFDIGQEFRNLRGLAKRNLVKINTNEIIESVTNNISKINQIGENFRQVIIDSKATVNEKFREFDQMQKALLFSSDADQNFTKAYKFDSMVTNIMESITNGMESESDDLNSDTNHKKINK
jgi:hypothetical protein